MPINDVFITLHQFFEKIIGSCSFCSFKHFLDNYSHTTTLAHIVDATKSRKNSKALHIHKSLPDYMFEYLISQLPNLRSVTINVLLTSSMSCHISKHPSIRHVTLYNYSEDSLYKLFSTPMLNSLSLTCPTFKLENIQAFSALNTKITSLSIEEIHDRQLRQMFIESAIEILTFMLTHSSVNSVEFELPLLSISSLTSVNSNVHTMRNSISPEGCCIQKMISMYQCLKQNRYLKKLELRLCSYHASYAIDSLFLESVFQCSSLRVLSISRYSLANVCSNTFQNTLTSLFLYTCFITDDDLKFICDTMKNLIHFELCYNNTELHSDTMEYLSKLENLTALCVARQYLSSNCMELICKNMTGLKKLILDACGIEDEGLQYMAKHTCLENVTLLDNHLTDEAMYHLSPSRTISSVRIEGNVKFNWNPLFLNWSIQELKTDQKMDGLFTLRLQENKNASILSNHFSWHTKQHDCSIMCNISF